ncbi:MAG TPA: hypothetical protein VGM80_02770, partial [Gaiellaceae bacterium]
MSRRMTFGNVAIAAATTMIVGVGVVSAVALGATRILGSSAVVHGQGTMTVSPSTVAESATISKLTFAFKATTAGAGGGGEVTLTVPSSWTAPHTGTPAKGRITLVPKTCKNAKVSVSGRRVTIKATCAKGDGFRLTYGGAKVPTKTGTATFAVSTADGSHVHGAFKLGKLHAIKKQPVVHIAALPVTHLRVITPSSAKSGSAFAITISGLDKNGNLVKTYKGPVRVSSSDGAAVLPAAGGLKAGKGTF